MAGSYNHCVDTRTDKLLVNEQLQGMLECCSGDVYEAIVQMYGMIWWLARHISANPARHVEDARRLYEAGLLLSPGIDGELPEEE